MEFFEICAVLVFSSAALLLICSKEKEISALISTLIYVFAFAYALTKGVKFCEELKPLLEKAQLYLPLKTIIRTGSIAALGTLTSSVCEGVGQKEIARAVETISVIEIFCIFIPVCREAFEKMFVFFGD